MKTHGVATNIISFISILFLVVFSVYAVEEDYSLEELKKMRDELKNNIEKLHIEIQESKNKQNKDGINSEDEIKKLRLEIERINSVINKEIDKLNSKIVEKNGITDEDIQEDLKEEVDELREEIEEARNSLDEELDELEEEIDEAKEDLEEELEDIKEEAEEDDHAASFVFCPRLMWLDKNPLELLQSADGNLSGKVFNFNNNKSFMLGFMNYYSIENGFRIGTGVSGGYKKFESAPYQSVVMDTTFDTLGAVDTIVQMNVDSIITLHVIPAHIGFVCEKVFQFAKWDIFTGFMIGGGAQVIVKNNKLYTVNDIFINPNGDDIKAHNNYSAVVAPSFMWDIHAGAAVEVAPKFHFGLDCVLLFSYAHDGFNGRTKDFVTVNPVIRLRLSVGGAG